MICPTIINKVRLDDQWSKGTKRWNNPTTFMDSELIMI